MQNRSLWPTKKLGEICQIRTGKKDVDEGNPEGGYPFFTCSREITYSDTYSFDTEAILVAGNGDVGNTKIYKGKFEAYQRTYVLDHFKADIKYIYYYLVARLKQILARSKSGSTMPYIRKGDLETFEISIPEDPKEQQKIVYILDSIQSAIQVQDKIIEKTKELKKSLMQKLFREGTRGVKLKKTEIGEIPENWEVVRLGDDKIAKIIMGQSPPSATYNTQGKGIPFLQGKAEFGEVFPKPAKWCTSPLKIAKKGDILISVRAPVGDVNLTPFQCCIGRGLAAIRVKSKLNRDFLFNYLVLYKNRLEEEGTGSTFKAIRKDNLENFQIPLSPFHEQREIAEILQTVDKKIEIEQKKKALYEELFKSMLNQLMTGKIRVHNLKL
ncbi:MAG: restriction endonuclease subunit S [Patescibacteria group bacterium]|nr:restriction endonuclease subunit S [Patescibacteria group bacterium]